MRRVTTRGLVLFRCSGNGFLAGVGEDLSGAAGFVHAVDGRRSGCWQRLDFRHPGVREQGVSCWCNWGVDAAALGPNTIADGRVGKMECSEMTAHAGKWFRSGFCRIVLWQWVVFLSWLVGANVFAAADMPGGPKNHQLSFAEPVTQVARDVQGLHTFLMLVCVAIFLLVFGVMFYSILKHRKSKGHKAAQFHESTAVEIAWTVIPLLIVIGMALPATRLILEQKDTSNADLTIKVTGYQWKWGYEYLHGPGTGVSFFSTLATPWSEIDDREFADAPQNRLKNISYLMDVDHPLVVPVNQKIRIILTANDVIHSWMVPAFAVKQDAIPGFVRDTWFRAEKEGVYRGQCAELCGKGHSFMPIVVDVRSKADYEKWVDLKKKEMLAQADDPNKEWTAQELHARGEKVYAANCVPCHQATGRGVPPTFPPLVGSKVVLGKKEGQVQVLLQGRPGTAMASFKHLSDVELAAVMSYTRNAWGNEASGEDKIVQPSFVKAARGK